MKQPLLLIFCIAVFALGSCAQGRKAAADGGAGAPNYQSISMSRTACFGRCPEYTITVYPDGRAVYKGRRNVPFTGVYEQNIGTDKTNKIFSEFAKYRVDTCASQYVMRVADVPGINYQIALENDAVKSIRSANFGPQFLGQLARMIDDEVKPDARWKKTGEVVEDR